MASVLDAQGVNLRQNVVYRARLEIRSPFGPAATQGAVASELGKNGFVDLRFYEGDALPADWPLVERDDQSGFLGKTYYLEGRFSLTDRKITYAELGDKVNLRSMWEYQVPSASPQIAAPPPVAAAPPPPPPVNVTGPMLIGVGLGVGVVCACMALSR